MFINISAKVRVWISGSQLDFLKKYSKKPSFRQSELSVEEVRIAKLLADKSVLVRKKLTTDTQFAVNRTIRISHHGNKK
tara:strand:- start:788 stop:1024 length:237 start_codon:yes stop_codon:yes gene_type:complete